MSKVVAVKQYYEIDELQKKVLIYFLEIGGVRFAIINT